MQAWLGTIIIFLVQETASLTARLVVLRGQGVNAWVLHVLFIAATTADIFIGFAVGKFFHRKFSGVSRLEKWIKSKARFLKQPGWEYLLTLAGIINFPYLNALLGAWLDLPFWRVFAATLIGDMIAYALYWGFALGIVNLSLNIYLGAALVVTVIVGLGVLFQKYLFIA